MLKEGKFGAAEGISVATVVVTTKIFLDTPRHFVEIGKTGAWLVPVVATSVGLIGFLFLALFMKQYPNGTLVEAVEKTLGPAMGSAVNYFYLVIFITFTSISLRQFAEYIILLALPLFPLSVTVILFIIPMVITVIIGLESIARSLYIASPFMLAAVFIVLFLLYPYYNIYNKDYTLDNIQFINQDKILNIPIPVPPIDKQKQIANYITLLKNKINELNSMSSKNKEEAIKEFEREIFKS